jgi:glutathione S-transferase
MITLYHTPQSRSARARWMLEELGVPYEVKKIDLAAGEQKRPEYLRLNPNGTVPTLVDGDFVLFESAAIVQHLADKFPEKHRAPPLGTPARGLYYQWMHYAMATVEPPLVTIFMHTIMLPEAQRLPRLVDEGRTAVGPALDLLEQKLAGREFILGDELSAADVMLGSTLGWARMMQIVADDRPNLTAYVLRLASRPAYANASEH